MSHLLDSQAASMQVFLRFVVPPEPDYGRHESMHELFLLFSLFSFKGPKLIVMFMH